MRSSLAGTLRDWRFRTIVPVLLIHLAAFAALYALMHHFAVTNLIKTQQFGASVLFDEIEFNFRDMMVAQTRDTLRTRMLRQTETHGLLGINVYNAAAQPVFSTRAAPGNEDVAEARRAFSWPGKPMLWSTREGNSTSIVGVRTLHNAAECYSCHGTQASRLGAIQVAIDITDELREAKASVARQFGLVGVAWIGLVVFVSGFRNNIIGRPLANIHSSINALAPRHGDEPHDLDALAQQLHDALWGMIRAQRQREADIARQMVRAEQLASLGELAAGLTHEIRNPVAGVIAALELLRSDGREADRELYEQMLSELRRASSTLDSLLRLARPQPPQRVETDLARIVREVSSFFVARLRRQGIAFEVDIAESLPLLSLDPRLITQLLVNLLTNSMQATERGGTIRVLVAPFPRHDGVALAVSDTGRGIDPEHLNRVFDPFFTTKESGTGLGLAICRQIVEQHGGTIDIESKPGEGTRIIVLLAAGTVAEEEDLDDASAAG